MLSDALIEHYTTNTYVQTYDALIFSHPTFTEDFRFVNDPSSHLWKLEEGGEYVEFTPAPFAFKLPQVGEGQQDLTISMPNVGAEMTQQIEKAVEDGRPILAKYLVYIEGDDLPQTDLDYLEIKKVTFDEQQVTAQASRYDLYKRYLLGNNTYDYRWEAMWLS